MWKSFIIQCKVQDKSEIVRKLKYIQKRFWDPNNTSTKVKFWHRMYIGKIELRFRKYSENFNLRPFWKCLVLFCDFINIGVILFPQIYKFTHPKIHDVPQINHCRFIIGVSKTILVIFLKKTLSQNFVKNSTFGVTIPFKINIGLFVMV